MSGSLRGVPPARVAVDAEDAIRTKVLYTEKLKADTITFHLSDVRAFLAELDEERRQSNEAYREWHRRLEEVRRALGLLLAGRLWDAVDALRDLLGLEDVGEVYSRPVRHFYDGLPFSTLRPERSEAYLKWQHERCRVWRQKRKEARDGEG